MPLRLLIVDDNRDNANTLAALLQHEGCLVRVAYEGQQAIDIALAFHPDVLVVDLVMPILDGFQVARRLRALPEFARSVFVALTGYSDQSHLDEASQAQFDEYIVKPPKLSLLLDIIAEASQRIEK